MYDDPNDHPFAAFMAGEAYESPEERRWLAWCAKVERVLCHDLDGNEALDGYSMDGAYAAFEAGLTTAAYAGEVTVAKRALQGLV